MSVLIENVTSSKPGAAPGTWLSRLPGWLLLLAVACGAVGCFLFPFNHDASYLLYAAGRVLGGATLYVDLPEINPPLIVWLQLPLAWLAQHTGLAEALLFRVALLSLAVCSVAWSGVLLRDFLPDGAWWSWLAAAVFSAFLAPGYDFGEREHIVLLCILPYLAEAGRRASGQPAARRVQVKVAILATVGLALKPHFLLAPLLVEAFIARRTRRLGVGCAVAAGMLLGYLGAVVLWAPAYFDMVRMFASGYWGSSRGFLVFLEAPSFYACAALAVLALLGRPRFGQLGAVVALAAGALALAAIVQQKGWAYHWLPALSLTWLLFGLGLASATAQRQVGGAAFSAVAMSAAVAALGLSGLATARQDGNTANPFPAELAPLIRELGGGPVVIASPVFRSSFPLVTEAGIGTSTRFPAMNIVTAMERGGNPAAIRWVHRAFAEDFYRQPPRLLLMMTDEQGLPLFNLVDYFSPDVPELRQYRLVRRLPHLQVLAAPVR